MAAAEKQRVRLTSRMLQPGDMVVIFERPLTEEAEEGVARVSHVCRQQEHTVDVSVKFPGSGEPTVRRTVLRPPLVEASL